MGTGMRTEDEQPKLDSGMVAGALSHHALFAQGWERDSGSLKAPFSIFSHPIAGRSGVVGVNRDGSWYHASLHNAPGPGPKWQYHGKGEDHKSLIKYLGKIHGKERGVRWGKNGPETIGESDELADKIRKALPMALIQQTLHKHGWRASRGNEGDREIEFFHGNANHTAAGYHRINARHEGDWMFSKYNGHKRGGWEGLKMGKGHHSLNDFLTKFHAGKLGTIRPSLKPHTNEDLEDLAQDIRKALPQALAHRVLHSHGFEQTMAPRGWVSTDPETGGYAMWAKAPYSATVFHDGSWELNKYDHKQGFSPVDRAKGNGHAALRAHLQGMGMKAEGKMTESWIEAVIETGASWILTELSFTKAELENSLGKLDVNTASRWIALGGGHKKTLDTITRLANVYGVDIPDSAHETLKIASKGWRKAKGSHQIKYYRRNESIAEMAQPVAHVWGGRVVMCPECDNALLRGVSNPGESPDMKSTPLYRENIHPYHQTCHMCGKKVHEGGTGWVELYDHPEKPRTGAYVNPATAHWANECFCGEVRPQLDEATSPMVPVPFHAHPAIKKLSHVYFPSMKGEPDPHGIHNQWWVLRHVGPESTYLTSVDTKTFKTVPTAHIHQLPTQVHPYKRDVAMDDDWSWNRRLPDRGYDVVKADEPRKLTSREKALRKKKGLPTESVLDRAERFLRG
jgi:hypothetical protein